MPYQPLLNWYKRERFFTTFTQHELAHFWENRHEGHFLGKDQIKLAYASFVHPNHQRLIVIVTGRGESYFNYQEVIYDLFHSGYDVFIYDHRGQGFSERLLEDRQKGHVEHFEDYVVDLETFLNHIVRPINRQQCYLLAHSMGGTISGLYLLKKNHPFIAAAFTAPMIKIHFSAPYAVIQSILALTKYSSHFKTSYAITTGPWKSTLFKNNPFTHSIKRLYWDQSLYLKYPQIQIGGPTYHWVYEAMRAGLNLLDQADQINCPILILQANKDKIVKNSALQQFYQKLKKNMPNTQYVEIQGAHHEILLEKDALRGQALDHIIHFFQTHPVLLP